MRCPYRGSGAPLAHLAAFYPEAKRILQPGGVLAVWTYKELRIAPEIDALVGGFHDEIVGTFWPPERKLVGRGYRVLPFPFQELKTPAFQIEIRWSLAHLLGYLRTWSATQRYLAAKKRDPVAEIADELGALWGNATKERVAVWPLTTRMGRAQDLPPALTH